MSRQYFHLRPSEIGGDTVPPIFGRFVFYPNLSISYGGTRISQLKKNTRKKKRKIDYKAKMCEGSRLLISR